MLKMIFCWRPNQCPTRSLAVVLSFTLASCAQFPKPLDAPSQLAEPPANWTAPGAMTAADVTGWLDDFSGGSLRAVVTEALEKNPNLQAVAARLRSAKYRAVRTGAERLPQLEAQLSGNQILRQPGVNTSDPTATGRLRARNDSFSFDLGLTWEIDLWGRLHNETQGAKADAQAAEADFHAARLSLAANVAKAWCDVIAAQQLADLSDRTVASFTKSLESVKSSLDRGVAGVSALDEKLATANLSSAKSTSESRKADVDAAKRLLEMYLGRYPAAGVKVPTALPKLTTHVPAGLPSALLHRRPDIRAAERRAAAQQARVNAAWKSLLPAFRLTAGGGHTSDKLRDVLDESKLIYNIAEGLTQPIFQGGRLLAEARIAEAERDALAATYAETALQAFREVETALAAESYLKRQIAALHAAVKDAQAAEKLALENHSQGLATYVTVLEAQRRSVESQATLIRAENELRQNRIDLHLALGGDF